MKTFMIASTAMLLAMSTSAFAQVVNTKGNDSTVLQFGVGNSANVGQASAGINASTVIQAGNENSANVSQGNTGNTSTAIQGLNDAAIGFAGQGQGNPFQQLFDGLPTTVQEESTASQVNISQTGEGNINQITYQGGTNNYAGLTQNGSANDSTIVQSSLGDGAGGVLLQNDNGHTAYVDQQGDGSISTVVQNGDANAAFLSQSGNDASVIIQLGALNTANVTQ